MNNLAEGLILGLANTATCAGVCAPVLVPYMMSEGHAARPVLGFLAGRFTAYMAFAFLAGWTGVYFEGRLHPDIFAALTVLLSLWLLAYAFGKAALPFSLCRSAGSFVSGKYLPFYAGIVMGLNPCPPFLLGLDRTLQMHDIAGSLVFFSGFYAGSSAWIAALLFTDKLLDNRAALVIGRIASFLAGAWYLSQSVLLLLR